MDQWVPAGEAYAPSEALVGDDERRERMIERLAEWIEAKGLRSPAILFLEANKPLTLIGSQVLLFLQPLLGFIGPTLGWFDDDRILAEFATLLEDPASIDRILERLERRTTERG